MADNIDKSLDEIITAKRRGGFRGRRGSGNRARGRRGASANRGRSGAPVRRGRRGMRRGGSFNTPSSNQSPGGKWQHDMYQGGGDVSRGGSVRTGTRGGRGSKLLISNLDYGVTGDDIMELFSEFGKVIKAEVHYDKSGRSLGTANVIYTRDADAVKAVGQYNQVPLDGRPMSVQLLTATANSGGGTPRGGNRQRGGGGGRQQNTGGTWRAGGGGGGRRGTRGRGRGRGGRGRGGFQKTPVPTADQLDADLDAYKGSGEAMET